MTPPRFSEATLSPERVAALRAAVKPPREGWTRIPWHTDLDAARRQAARQKKPLLLWIMDGHPLGCT